MIVPAMNIRPTMFRHSDGGLSRGKAEPQANVSLADATAWRRFVVSPRHTTQIFAGFFRNMVGMIVAENSVLDQNR